MRRFVAVLGVTFSLMILTASALQTAGPGVPGQAQAAADQEAGAPTLHQDFVPEAGTQDQLVSRYQATRENNDRVRRDYYVLDEPVSSFDGNENTVHILFNYSCGPCRMFHETLLRRVAGGELNATKIIHLPAMYDQSHVPLARAFYARSLLQMPKDSHDSMFEAAMDPTRGATHIERLVRWYDNQGISHEELQEAMNAPEVAGLLKELASFQKRAAMQAVPWIVVNGRYVVLPEPMDQYEHTFRAINWLLEHKPAGG